MISKLKYVIIGDDDIFGKAIVASPKTGIEHSQMIPAGQTAYSAGFVTFGNKAECWGESHSLGLKSRTIDSKILTIQFFGSEPI